jgi:hypothetical protein
LTADYADFLTATADRLMRSSRLSLVFADVFSNAAAPYAASYLFSLCCRIGRRDRFYVHSTCGTDRFDGI